MSVLLGVNTLNMYRNSFDKTGDCAVMGQNAEKLFHQLLTQRGSVNKASLQEEYSHVDFILTAKDNKKLKYEVKARKRVSRADSQTTVDLVWIELLIVRGDAGWLFGKADKIAFEQEKEFIVVDRERLVEFVKNKCKPFDIVQSPADALHKGYRRFGRKDHLTIILTSDLRSIAEEIIFKN